jgi:hypothetical protein
MVNELGKPALDLDIMSWFRMRSYFYFVFLIQLLNTNNEEENEYQSPYTGDLWEYAAGPQR